MILKILILFFTLYVSILSADTINISSLKEPTNILKQVDLYIDKENINNFQYIQENSEKLFKENNKELLHLGYSPNAIWLKFSIQNDTNSSIKKVLEISNQMLDDIFLYTKQSDGSYSEEKLGVMHNRIFNENILKMYFDISIKPNEVKEYYLKLASLSCAVFLELNVMSKNELYKKEINYQLVLALFFGSIVTLIIYNLFVFLFTKDLAYLYYSIYIFFVGWNHLSYSAFGLYVLPSYLWQYDAYFAIYYLSLLSIFALLFTIVFLDIKRYKKLHFIFKAFIAIAIMIIIFTSPDFYPIDVVSLILISSLIYIIFVSFYLSYKGVKNAQLMLVGWSIALVGWIMLANYNYGYWNLITYYPYFYEFAIFAEAALFSVALANKLNTTKELEKSVSTNKVLTRELHHRVKNNMQFIISMYRLKLAKFVNHDISDSLKEVEGTIQAMSATHEMLYDQKMVEHIDAKEYFRTLIDRLKNSYDTSSIDIKLDINANLNIDNSIYVGIILNELITNSFKYAFEDNSGQISISLNKHKNYELIVADDGVGFDNTKESETFGIELVKTLVEDELNGVLKVDTTNGCKYTIEWS